MHGDGRYFSYKLHVRLIAGWEEQTGVSDVMDESGVSGVMDESGVSDVMDESDVSDVMDE